MRSRRGFLGCKRWIRFWRPPWMSAADPTHMVSWLCHLKSYLTSDNQLPITDVTVQYVTYLSQSEGIGGKNSPQCNFLLRKACGQRTARNDVLSLFIQREEWANRNWIVRLLHSVLLNSGTVGSSVCSNKVSGVLLVMITDMSRSGRTGSPCAKNGTGEVGELSSEGCWW